MPEHNETASFWSSIPGILTGIAGVIGAIAAIIVAIHNLPTASEPAKQTCPDGSVTLATSSCPGPVKKTCADGSVILATATCSEPAKKTCADGSVVLATDTCAGPTKKTCGDGSVILATDTCPVVMGPLEMDTNRQGNDFDAFGISTANAQLCAEECRTKSTCDAMTYVKSTRVCWLKHGVPGATPNADMISSVKQKS